MRKLLQRWPPIPIIMLYKQTSEANASAWLPLSWTKLPLWEQLVKMSSMLTWQQKKDFKKQRKGQMQINCWIPSSRPGSRTRSLGAKSSRKNLLRGLQLPGNTSAVDPNAAKSRPGSGARSRVRKSRAGRRGVGQHVVQKEARKTSEDVHGTEDGREKLVNSTARGEKSWSQMEKCSECRRTFSKQNKAELWLKGGE